MNEKLIEKKLILSVKKAGGLALKIWCVSFTGLPDRMILMPGGKIRFAEIKTTGKKPTPRQEYVIAFLRKLGFIVFVIDTEEKLQECLQQISE